jgi:hypothetical protein
MEMSGVLFTLISCTMIFSKKLSESDSKIGKLLYWISLNLLLPKDSYNYIKFGCVFLVLGILGFINGRFYNEQGSSSVLELTPRQLAERGFTDPMVWLVFFLLILFGIYNSRKD